MGVTGLLIVALIIICIRKYNREMPMPQEEIELPDLNKL